MNQLSPEEYQQLLELGSQNDELAQQREMAKQLRSPLQVRGGGGRGYQMAPHWSELVGNLANQYVGMEAGKKQAGNTNTQNQMIMRGILGQGGPLAATQFEAPPQKNPFSYDGN